MRVIVTGSSTWSDADAIRRELSRLPPKAVIIHGDCPGADSLAGEIAREMRLKVERWVKTKQDYRKYQSVAWKSLNERMLASGAVLVLAFHPEWHVEGKAPGTRHLIELAQAASIEVRAFNS